MIHGRRAGDGIEINIGAGHAGAQRGPGGFALRRRNGRRETAGVRAVEIRQFGAADLRSGKSCGAESIREDATDGPILPKTLARYFIKLAGDRADLGGKTRPAMPQPGAEMIPSFALPTPFACSLRHH